MYVGHLVILGWVFTVTSTIMVGPGLYFDIKYNSDLTISIRCPGYSIKYTLIVALQMQDIGVV